MSESLNCDCTCGRFGCASLRRAKRTHGIERTWAAGCRCDACVKAANVETGKRSKARNAQSRDQASRNGQVWTGSELEILMRSDLTGKEAAAMLGRTIKSVYCTRHLCRTDPKFIALLGAAKDAPDAEQAS